jgi:hypothetical protein
MYVSIYIYEKCKNVVIKTVLKFNSWQEDVFFLWRAFLSEKNCLIFGGLFERQRLRFLSLEFLQTF